MMRVAGFPRPGPGDRVLDEQVAGLAAGMAAAEAVFGEDAVLQLVRLMGSKAAQRHRAGWNEATSVARNGPHRTPFQPFYAPAGVAGRGSRSAQRARSRRTRA